MQFLLLSLIHLLIISLFYPFLKYHIKDFPKERSLHRKVAVSGGGLIFVINIIIYALISNDYIWLLTLPLSVTGLFDDKFDLSPILRTSIYSLVISLILFFNTEFFLNYNLYFILIPSLFVFGIYSINLFNFMDGLDGLVGGCFLIIVFKFCLLNNYPFIFLIPSLIAFLIYNWHPAKLFMGDTGSTFLGGIFFIMMLNQNNFINMIKFLLLTSPLLYDSVFTLLIRIKMGQNIFKPHKLHLYQRLNQAGIGQEKISIIYCFSTILLSINPIYNNIYLLFTSSIIILFIGLFINNKYTKPFVN